ncbi:MAG: zinc-ribbon domain-containing protein [Candidatus Odinarchaeum yellowstonii]|uniref:Zinc-ribbon domain-containing protein n=1 Tax=Odinarchaeota yellowstonii (strain LCB_4) TaxID=1841599 RepID=A0AAF0D1I7_ODILC|nr:MAG: zinc-ribbon domain-containing protein [Candidatus Odinarchaeum yellowstonii]
MEIKGYISIKGNLYPASEVFKAIARNPHIRISITSNGVLIIGDYKINRIDEPLPNIVKNILCFKALTYCCPLDKPCSNRDLALELLGINKTAYKELKEEFEGKMLKYSNQSSFRTEQELSRETLYGNQLKPEILEDWDFSPLSKPENPYEKIEETSKADNEVLNFFTVLNGEAQGDERKELYCNRCGRSVEESARFCPNCGSSIKRDLK